MYPSLLSAIYPSLLSAYTPHSYQHIHLTPTGMYTSLLSAHSPQSYQHISLAPISLYLSLLSAHPPHFYDLHIALTPVNIYRSLLSFFLVQCLRPLYLLPVAFAHDVRLRDAPNLGPSTSSMTHNHARADSVVSWYTLLDE